ncbi:MAG: SDR family NAD(P)-dependent oxidoreductase [Parvibaculum sp.]
MPGTIIITGGNQGLGFGAAKALRKLDPKAQIVLACRDEAKGRDAAKRLRGKGPDAICLPLDLASLASVRAFAAGFAEQKLPPLQALICNAGIQVVAKPELSRDGFELTFAVNHLAHFLLANLMLPHIEPGGRIVFVSSGTHDPARKTPLPAPRWTSAEALAQPANDGESSGKAGRRAYAMSKLCNVLCTYEFARCLETRNVPVTATAFDPGLMPGSGLARQYALPARLLWNSVFLLLPYFTSAASSMARSGRHLAKLAIDPTWNGVSGRYFEARGKTRLLDARSSELSYDVEKARELWQTSAILAGMTPEEAVLGR